MKTYRFPCSGFGAEDESYEEIQNTIKAMEDGLRETEQVEVPIWHEFADGIYYRKILLPAGVCLTGRVHKQNDLQIMYYGDITVITPDASVRLTGPNSMTSKAGVKPFAIVHEETLWSTVHHTHLTDLREIEKAIFEEEVGMLDFVTGKRLDTIDNCEQEVLSCLQL